MTSFTEWSEANNPFFEGAYADTLAMIPFGLLAIFLYYVGRELIFAPRKNM